MEQMKQPTAKRSLDRPTTALCPIPVVLVSCGRAGEDANLLTIAWAGVVNSDPPMVSISVRRERHSHSLLLRDREFVINVPSQEFVKETDWCGVKSGRDVDKWSEQGLTQAPAVKVQCPIVQEFPINLECKVTQIIELPSHDLFLAEVVNVQVNEDLLDAKGALHMEKARLVAYVHGKYYPVAGKQLLRFGESVMKPQTAKRIENERKAKRRQARRKS